jgi:hypothetical protein
LWRSCARETIDLTMPRLRSFRDLALALSLATSTACAVSEVDRPTVESGACLEAAEDVEAAWTAIVGPLPAECHDLARAYVLEMASRESMPCEEAEPGRITVGCTIYREREIWLLEGRTETETVDIAAHEWVHAYAACVFGDGDNGHENRELWERDLESVLGLAITSAPVGPCL